MGGRRGPPDRNPAAGRFQTAEPEADNRRLCVLHSRRGFRRKNNAERKRKQHHVVRRSPSDGDGRFRVLPVLVSLGSAAEKTVNCIVSKTKYLKRCVFAGFKGSFCDLV